MTNREWGQMGNNYLRGLVALGLQGFFIICAQNSGVQRLPHFLGGGAADVVIFAVLPLGAGHGDIRRLGRSPAGPTFILPSGNALGTRYCCVSPCLRPARAPILRIVNADVVDGEYAAQVHAGKAHQLAMVLIRVLGEIDFHVHAGDGRDLCAGFPALSAQFPSPP